MSWERLRNFTDIENTDTQLCNKTAINNNFASDTATLLFTRRGSFPHGYDVGDGEGIQLRFVQTNHRGGYCDCWGLACDILLLNSSGHIVNTINKQQIFCNDLRSNSSGSGADVSSGGSDTNGLLENATATGNSNDTGSASSVGSSSGNYGSGSEVAISGSGTGACPSDFPMVTECLPFYVCGGSASVERGFITEFTRPDNQTSCRPHSDDTFRIITEQRQHNIQMNDDCNVTEPYLEIAFTYIFRSLDSFDEGFELSFCDDMNGGGRWIPLWFFSAHESTSRTVHDINLGDITDDGLLSLRGYTVNYTVSENNINEANIKLCGPKVFNEQVDKGLFNWRFRWLQTVANSLIIDKDEDDVIYIYNVSITVVNDTRVPLFQDEFSEGDELSSDKWVRQRNVMQQMNCSEGLNDSCLEFSSTEKQPDCAVPITSREASTVCLNSITQIQYTLITASSSDCPGSGNLSSKFQFPQLQYRWMSRGWTEFHLDPVLTNESNIIRQDVMADLRNLEENQLSQCSFNHLQFRFIQREHRGGFCDCWAVTNLTATLTNGEVNNLRKSCGNTISRADLFMFNNDDTTQWDDGTVIAGFCGDSASVIRVFQTQSGSECTNDTENRLDSCNIQADSPYRSDCNDLRDLKIEVTFDLTFRFESCNEIQDFSEGVEFSVKKDNGEWIPLMFIAPCFTTTEPFIKLSEHIDDETSSFTLRGYTVPYVIQTKTVENYNISICRSDIFRDKLQFRWLQTSYQTDESVHDVVMLDNVTVRAGNCSNYVTLLSSNNSSLWDTALSYNVHPQCSPTCDSSCKPSSTDALFFYQHSVNLTRMFDNENYTITSRQAVTTEINLEMLNTTVPLPYRCQPTPPTSTTTKDNLFYVQESLGMENLSVIATTSNLSSILGEVKDQTVGLEISKLVLLISSRLLDIALNNFEAELVSPNDYLAGSTLLRLLENFALNNHDSSYPLVDSDNIILRVEEVSINSTNERISLIKGENATISIPREVIANVEGIESVRVVSLLYRNMSGLLPESLGMNDNDTDDDILRLASPVISMSVQCDGITCTTSDLSTPVEVTFTHTPYDTALLEDDSSFNATVTCVFWKFYPYDKQPEPLLFPGQWSTEGCERNLKSSTPNSTVCHCNHLTNFAILLSARPLDLPRDKTLALQITGYIGVSVSLVAMAATILVFVFLKPLRTMRNYIHIQLCVTLGIAQIIFVAGVEPRLGEGSRVLIGCRSVAVLLHYWFLVSFMWMLMEGVVLYVALVRVFVKHYARYIAAFTITSYGLPLLYVGALMLPLGFVRTSIYRQYHSYDYGYEQACYLNPDTSFVWSLIAPVIMIFLANFGFFIMAIAIMYRHQKRQHTEKKIHKVKHWIKASISLTVVMGITWIIGVLVIEVEELFAFAYIFTIFVAFQGVFIFVIFILFSKQVRENYAKWWKAKIAESDFLSKHFGDKTLGTGLTAQNKTPLPSYDKIDQKSSSTASKKCLEQSQAIEIESSYSQHKLPTVTVNSHDNGSHGSSVINDGATTLAALTENCFSFNITYIPSSVPLDSTASLSDSTAPLCDNNWSTDIKGEESEGSGDDIMEEVELHTRRATPNDYVLTNSFVCDPIIEDDQSSKL